MGQKRKRRKKFEIQEISHTGVKCFHLFNHYIFLILIIALVIVIPMTLVWKQVYITNTSVHFNLLKDSLDVLNKEVAELNILAEQLSCTERIESIALNSLGLDYPKFDEIVLIRSVNKKEKKIVFDPPFWAVLRRSIGSSAGSEKG